MSPLGVGRVSLWQELWSSFLYQILSRHWRRGKMASDCISHVLTGH